VRARRLSGRKSPRSTWSPATFTERRADEAESPSERYSFSTRYAATTDTGQVNANAYFIGYQLQLFNNFDGFVTFAPPIGDQFVQQDRRKIYGGNVSYMMPGNVLGYKRKTRSVSRPAPTTFISTWRKPLAGWCASQCATTM
jgi:hypothetical protein